MSILLKPLVSTVCMLINRLDCLVPGGAGFRLRCHHFCTCIGCESIYQWGHLCSEHLPDPTKTTVEGCERKPVYCTSFRGDNCHLVRFFDNHKNFHDMCPIRIPTWLGAKMANMKTPLSRFKILARVAITRASLQNFISSIQDSTQNIYQYLKSWKQL